MRQSGKHSFDSWSIEIRIKRSNVGELVLHEQHKHNINIKLWLCSGWYQINLINCMGSTATTCQHRCCGSLAVPRLLHPLEQNCLDFSPHQRAGWGTAPGWHRGMQHCPSSPSLMTTDQGPPNGFSILGHWNLSGTFLGSNGTLKHKQTGGNWWHQIWE